MIIKEYGTQELTLKCVELISKTFVELGQIKDEKHIVVLSQSLANDLQQDFESLYFEDIQQAFRQGVRNTDKFVLNVQTYYLWIKTHRQLIWNARGVQTETVDKRLKYRSRKGTGLISIQKKLK